MQTILTVAQQVLIIFLLIWVGITVRKTNLVTAEASRIFSNLLITVIMPAMLIDACIRPFRREDLQALGFAFLLALVFHILNIILATVLIRKREDPDYRVERMGAIYSNCGFMTFPILQATLGDIGVFYGIAYVAVSGIFSWTHGWHNLTGEKLNVRKVFLNPGMLAVLIGLPIYFLQIPLPGVVTETISMMGDVNTPLAMIITGIFLAEVDLKSLFTDFAVLLAAAVRLLIAPGAMLLILFLTRASGLFLAAGDVIFAHIVPAACPSAAFTILLVSRLRLNSGRSAGIIAVSTLFSVITVPLFAYLASLL